MVGKLLLAFLIVQFSADMSWADELPPQCRDDVELPDGPSTKMDHGKFSYQNEDYAYTLKSSWAVDPQKRETLCLRYDILSLDKKLIRRLRWPDAGLNWADVPADDVGLRYTTPGETRHPQAEVAETELTAFVDSKYRNYAFLTEELISQRPKKESSLEGSPPEVLTADAVTKAIGDESGIFRTFAYSLSDSYPDEAKYFSESGLTVSPVTELNRDYVAQFPVLTTKFSSSGVNIVYASSATEMGQGITIESQLSRGNAERVNNPWDETLKKFGDYSQFKNLAGDMAKLLMTNKTQETEFVENKAALVVNYKEWDRIFVVRHPITIKTDQTSACIVVKAYSLFPVSVDSSALCNDDEK